MGDVSGQGLPAALYAALAVGTLRGIHKTGQHPSRVLYLLNQRLLLRGIPGRHTAIQYAMFNPDRSEMCIASAGMPGPLLLRGGESQVLQVAGIPPGLFPDVTYDVLKVQLVPGDSVLFFTDGLTDARNINDQDFEVDSLKHVCSKHAGESRVELLGHIFNATRRILDKLPAMGRYDRGSFSLLPRRVNPCKSKFWRQVDNWAIAPARALILADFSSNNDRQSSIEDRSPR